MMFITCVDVYETLDNDDNYHHVPVLVGVCCSENGNPPTTPMGRFLFSPFQCRSFILMRKISINLHKKWDELSTDESFWSMLEGSF